jgi:hypothetical protein
MVHAAALAGLWAALAFGTDREGLSMVGLWGIPLLSPLLALPSRAITLVLARDARVPQSRDLT